MTYYRIGDVIETVTGVYRRGTVVPRFHWKRSTDGTFKAPRRSDVPVVWDDGTRGYANPAMIKLHIVEHTPRN
jgi:hypothetical protein